MKKYQYVIVVLSCALFGLLLLFFYKAFLGEQTSGQQAPQSFSLPVQAMTPAVSTIEQQGLTIILTTNRAIYALGEPVVITVTAQNQTAEPIVFNDGFTIVAGAIGVQIAGADHNFLGYDGPFPIAGGSFTPSTLNPGSDRSLSFTILYNDSTAPDYLPYFYAFAKPGVYQVRAILQNIIPRETIFSAPLSIEMLAPQGIDAQIWRLLQTEDAAHFLQTGSARQPEIEAATFTAILAQYPNTFYAPYLRTALASYETMQKQSGNNVQAAQSKSPVTVLSVNDQLFLARPAAEGDVGAAAVANTDVLADLIELTETWVAAWNEQDLDQYAQSYSYRNYTRQDWETGQGRRPYNKLRKRLETLFAENGRLTVEIISFAIGSGEITADAVGRFERGSKNYSFNTMRFVLDDDGVWRLYSPGF